MIYWGRRIGQGGRGDDLISQCPRVPRDEGQGLVGADYGDGTVGEAMQIDPQAKDVQTARATEIQEYESFEAAWEEVKGDNTKTSFFYDEDTGAKKPFYQEWEASQVKSTTQLSSVTLY